MASNLITYKSGIELISEERERQQQIGWTKEHDLEHNDNELAYVASCYLLDPWPDAPLPFNWPWSPEHWKPKDRLSNLIRAGALIAAEIDRIQNKNQQ